MVTRKEFVCLMLLQLGIGHSWSVRAHRAPPQGTSTDDDIRELGKWLSFLRERNARTYAITTPKGIDEGSYVKIGGIEQWITIRGRDRGNPVLLFLHGGPGDVTNPWAYALFNSW